MTDQAVSNHREPEYVCFVEVLSDDLHVWHVLRDTLQDALGEEPFCLVGRETLEKVLALARFVIASENHYARELAGEKVEHFPCFNELLSDGHAFVVDEAGEGVTVKCIATDYDCTGLELPSSLNGFDYRTLVVKGDVKVADEEIGFGATLKYVGSFPLPGDPDPFLEA